MAAPRLEEGGVGWWLREGLAEDAARPLLAAALSALARGAPNRKRGRRKELYWLSLQGGEAPDHLLKVNRYPDAPRRRRSKARRELALAEHVAARGIATPRPVAAGERRAGGRLEACYLLVPVLPDATDLRALWFGTEPSAAERRALARALGAVARRLHEAGIHQDDFQPNNFLVERGAPGDAPRLWVIDFERARVRRRVPDRLRRRALAKLDREMGRTPRGHRMRFLQAYAGDDPARARAWWRAVAEEAPLLARRDVARRLRNAAHPGRRARRAALPGWTGLAAPDAEDGHLRRAVALVEGTSDPAPPGAARGAPDLDAWTLPLARAGVRHARRAWSRALVLAERELAPRPLAVLCGRRSAVLVLERAPRALALSEVRHNASVDAALRVLARRLEAYGRLSGPLDGDAVAVAPAGPGRVRAWLLDVERFAAARRGLPLRALRRRCDAPGAPAGSAP